MNEFVATTNNLTNNFAGLVTSCLGPDVTRGPPVVHAGLHNSLVYKIHVNILLNHTLS
jgi:hypothetical protein